MPVEQEREIQTAVKKEKTRLLNFIKSKVRNPIDAEDILQDVFYQLVRTVQVNEPIDQISSWMFRVARNRIIDLFRKKKTESLESIAAKKGDEGESLNIADFLPSNGASPEGEFARKVIIAEIKEALSELPEEQSEVFEMHELDGLSFNQIAEITGESVNTLVSRKRYAVLFLRKRLKGIYDELIND
ncbi:MAG: sigma-70 family RNA polymerase sigma factor [Flavobacteriales bacterium]|nr:sigma-70 family RNA polymerase sigma factor [Flavobacteriales bacterium]